jgi:hypothetical protein
MCKSPHVPSPHGLRWHGANLLYERHVFAITLSTAPEALLSMVSPDEVRGSGGKSDRGASLEGVRYGYFNRTSPRFIRRRPNGRSLRTSPPDIAAHLAAVVLLAEHSTLG